jgi:hypothetical protein
MRARRALYLLGVVGALAGCTKGHGADAGNLLASRHPTRTAGVERAEVLTDDVVAADGDAWTTDLSARFSSRAAYVEYDLGESREISSALLQADNNDEYVVTLSEDGESYSPLWSAPPITDGGQRMRLTTKLAGKGRYVRLLPAEGDGHFSVTELQLFSGVPPTFPPRLSVRSPALLAEVARGSILLFAASLLAFLVSTARAFHRGWAWTAAGFVVLIACRLVGDVQSAWPLASMDVSLVRAVAAATAAAAVAAIWLAPRFRPSSRATTAVLATCAAAAVAAFFNLGRPQFIDHTTGRPSMVHNFDMRVYFPIAKYFEELRFDGLYMASVAAYADDGAGATLTSLADTPLRDLETLRVERIGNVEAHVRSIRERFSPERWATFRQDMRYFRQTMGVDDYLGSLTDHGGNATPVWFTEARLLFSRAEACNTTLLATALLDPILLLLMFVAVGRSFGLKMMLMSMIVFGANDFYMFGTNWAGATLRHDWLAFLGLGICALKVERWMLGGVLLAAAGMMRAFPALAVVACLMPFGWRIWESRNASGGWPSRIDDEYRRNLRIAVGAVGCVIILVVVSSLVLSPTAWADWLHKVSMLDRSGSMNEISLRALVAGNGNDRDTILTVLWPIRVIGIGITIAAVVAATRRRPPHQAALLGLLLVPVLFNPSNYYLHFVCLLPLLADEQVSSEGTGQWWISSRGAATLSILLLLCAAQYWTVLERDIALHFRFATVLYFGMLMFVVINALRQNAERQVVQTRFPILAPRLPAGRPSRVWVRH